jgi:hypothetical protein
MTTANKLAKAAATTKNETSRLLDPSNALFELLLQDAK